MGISAPSKKGVKGYNKKKNKNNIKKTRFLDAPEDDCHNYGHFGILVFAALLTLFFLFFSHIPFFYYWDLQRCEGDRLGSPGVASISISQQESPER